MDIEMPGINGLDAARAVLEQRPECKVIFVTAYSLFQYAHEAMHLGACDYLLKPVDPDEAEAAIRHADRSDRGGAQIGGAGSGGPGTGCRYRRGRGPQCAGHGPRPPLYGG